VHPCIEYLRTGYFKDPKGYRWAFGIAALEMEEIKQLSILPGLSEDPSVVGLLRVEGANRDHNGAPGTVSHEP